MEPITSKKNPQIVELRKLAQKKHRQRLGLFAAAGEDFLTAAQRNGQLPERIYYDCDKLCEKDAPLSVFAACERTAVSGEVLASASELASGTRVISVWRRPEYTLGDLQESEVVVYLDRPTDPANIGSVIRSINALSSGVLCLPPDSADPYSPKSVRVSMGSIFAVPVIESDFASLSAYLGSGYHKIALEPSVGDVLADVISPLPSVLCIGSERSGLSSQVLDGCDAVAEVPMQASGPEALNLAVTAGIALYELMRNRIKNTG